MKENLLQLADYLSSLEQRISDLEKKLCSSEHANAELLEQIALFRTRIEDLEARPIAAANEDNEPEVEVDLIFPEDEEVEVPAEAVPEEEAPAAEPESAPEEPIAEPAAEEPAEEAPMEEAPAAEAPAPVQEPEAEPTPDLEPEDVPAHFEPVQTSLFGAPVSDIRQAISLGDRFLFQRELFASNGEAMQKALDDINTLGSLDEAMNYISRFNWDTSSNTFELFVNILRRRF